MWYLLDGRGREWSMTAMRMGYFSRRLWLSVLFLAGALVLAAAAGANERTAEAMMARGQAAAEAGRLSEAQGWYERAVVQLPASAEAYARLGHVEVELEDTVRARKHFRIALEIDPNHADALNWAGQLDAREGRGDAARMKLSRLSRTCEDCPQTAALTRALNASVPN